MKIKVLRGMSFEYIEVFIILLLSVGAVDDLPWSVISLAVIAYNIYIFKSCKYPYSILTVIAILLLSFIFDLYNLSAGVRISLAGFAFVIPFVFGGVIAKKYSYESFCRILENVIFFVCVVSLLGFAVLITAPQVIMSFPVITFGGRQVYTCGLFNAIHLTWNSGPLLSRNCGIGFEPGIFQFVPNLGIAIMADRRVKTLYKRSKGNATIHLIVYIVTVLTTFSTTGAAVLAVNLLLYFISKGISIKKILGSLVVLGIMGIPFMSQLEYQVGKLSDGYFYRRFEPSIHIIKEYSGYIFGVGNVGFNRLEDNDPLVNGWDIFTNYFLRYGIVFIIVFIYLNLRLLKINMNLFFVVVLTALAESVRSYIPVVFFFYTYAMYSGTNNNNIAFNRRYVYESDVGLQYSQSGCISSQR